MHILPLSTSIIKQTFKKRLTPPRQGHRQVFLLLFAHADCRNASAAYMEQCFKSPYRIPGIQPPLLFMELLLAQNAALIGQSTYEFCSD